MWGAERFTAHDATNGNTLWSCAGFNPDSKNNWVVVSSFVIINDRAVIPYGRGARLAACTPAELTLGALDLSYLFRNIRHGKEKDGGVPA